MAAYTDADTIEAALGVTFTPAQAAQAEAVAEAATAFIDRYCARTWQLVSPVEGEVLPIVAEAGPAPPASATVYLTHRPVLAVSAVSIRSSGPNATPTVLDVAAYELLDPTNGVLRLASWYPASAGTLALAVVDYTYADEVPADIELAATMIGAQQMARLLAIQASSGLVASTPELAGLESIAVGQNDVSVKLSSAGAAGGGGSATGSSWAAPGSAVAAILDGHRAVVIA